MAYRNIFIANTAKLSSKNEQLIVDNGEITSIPVEDIRCVLIEDCRCVLSAALLSKFAKAGVTVIICDEKHSPVGSLNPLGSYSRQLRQIELQTQATLPFKKRIWQKIVSRKILNQAKCLEICGKDGAGFLANLAGSVKSGDTANVEGRAAAFYFKALFGGGFRRGDEAPENAALDYGYAIIRALISRTLCLYGFEPALGIHHRSELNNFNLSDDIIEPFRPVIDMTVFTALPDFEKFDSAAKAALLKTINSCVIINGKKYSVANAVEIMVQSYAECLRTGEPGISVPELIEPEYVNYE